MEAANYEPWIIGAADRADRRTVRNRGQPPRRIVITGAPGSGKTMLARRLAARMGLPRVELDDIVFEPAAALKRPFAQRMALAQEIVSRSAWVAEGNYLWWAQDLYRAADLVIWLDLPWHTAVTRTIIRHVRETLRGTNRHPGLLRFIRWLWRYRHYYFNREPDIPRGLDDDLAGNRAATAQFLREYSDKLAVCRSTRDVNRLIHVICASGSRHSRNSDWSAGKQSKKRT